MMKSVSVKKEKSHQGAFVIGGIVALFFGFLVVKEVELNPMVILPAAMLGFLFLFFKSMHSPLPALYFAVCYIPFSKILVGDFGGALQALNLTNVIMIFMLIGMMAQSSRTGRPLFTSNALNFPVFLFALAALISFIRASSFFGVGGDMVSLFIQLKRWMTPLLLFYLAYNSLNDRSSIQNTVKIIMIVVTVVGLMAAWDYFNVSPGTKLENARVGGIADQPNQLAGFFVYYMFLFPAFFTLRYKSWRSWGLLLPFLICFRGIQVTFSRGGYLAFAFGVLAFSFFRSKKLLLLVIGTAIFALLNPWMLPQGIRYRIGQTIEQNSACDAPIEESLEGSSRLRIEIWKTSLEMIKDEPFLGFGYETFRYVLGYYNPQVGRFDAHNSYIIIAAEMGIPALLIFLAIILIIIKETLWVYYRTSDYFYKATALGFLGGLFGLLVVNFFGSRLNSQEISGYFWILAAIILKIKDLEMKRSLEEKTLSNGLTVNQKRKSKSA